MLIEDSRFLQEILKSILCDLEGVEICSTVAGEHMALQYMATSPVDLVIIDINLEEGSGIGVLSALQTDPHRFGVPRKVVLSNFTHDSMRQRCEGLGMDAFFDKSLHMNQLVDYVSDVVKQQRSFPKRC